MRLLIVTGHSQLLRSATAIATACAAAQQGQRVLLAGIGPTHMIGALLSQTLGPRPIELAPNLAAMETVAIDEAGQKWDGLRPTFRSGLAARLRDIGAEELPSFPGLDAVGAILVADRARQSGRFDLLVLDGPSPDSLIRTLSLPDTLRWFLRLVFGLDRGPGRSRTSQETAMIPAALIAPTAISPLQDLRVALEDQRKSLESSSGARVRLALAAPEVNLPATRETMVGLGLYGVEVDRVIVDTTQYPLSDSDRAAYTGGGTQIRPPLHTGSIDQSITDLAGWNARGQALYGSLAPGIDTSIAARSMITEREVRLHIPFIEPKGLDIAMASEELVVRLGSYRRHLIMPALLSGGKLRARVEEELLRLWVE